MQAFRAMVSLVLGAAVAICHWPLAAQTTAAGFTPGTFSVSETGAALYSIPIQVPPGVRGIEPKLALVYNSQAGNGYLGVGWSLQGMAAVERCGKTIAQGGVRTAVKYDSTDRYCFNGERLVGVAGTYGGGNEDEYRTERESFARFYSYGQAGGGPTSFLASIKGGPIMEFGGTGGCRFEALGKSSVRVYALSRMWDWSGNTLSVGCSEDTNGDARPAIIDYTQNSTGGLANFARVEFWYATRPDPIRRNIAGSDVAILGRITNIKTLLGTNPVKDYRFAYEQSPATGRSRLTSVTECSGDGSQCLVAATFDYSDYSGAGSGTWTGGHSTSSAGWRLADLFGEGRQLYFTHDGAGTHRANRLNPGAGVSSWTWTGGHGLGNAGWEVADLFGDGRQLYWTHSTNGTHYATRLNSNGTVQNWTWTGGHGVGNAGWTFADLFGDGRNLYYTYSTGGNHYATRLNPGQSTGENFTWSGSGPGSSNWKTGDLFGDGRELIVWYSGTTVSAVRLNADQTMDPAFSWNVSGFSVGPEWRLADLFGDGRQVFYTNWDNGTHYAVRLNSDGSYNTFTWTGTPLPGNVGWELADVLGDGRMVYTTHGSNGMHTAVRFNAGSPPTFTSANGLTTTRTYDTLDRPTGSVVSGSSGTLQDFTYRYDAVGNLLQRVDATQSVTENFSYDKLNRLDVSFGPTLSTKTVSYDAHGNILQRSDVGTYTYGTKPRAVASVAGTLNASYTYDANGNMSGGNGRSITYTSYNMPQTITGNGHTYTYTYNAEHERMRLAHSTLGTFIYLHPAGKGQLLYEKQIHPGGLTEHKHYLSAGGALVGLYISRSDATQATRYFHQDHLGSLTLVTDASGAVIERLAYDAWGKRRFPNGSDDTGNTLNPASTDRGFTAHEHLDELTLIHMNGRIYDPVLARFMTPDPFVQNVGDLQAHNRYSYVLNNPLAYTDPSGYFLKKLARGISKGFRSISRGFSSIARRIDRIADKVADVVSNTVKAAIDNPLRTAAIIAAAYFTGGAVSAALGTSSSGTFVAASWGASEFAAAGYTLTTAGTAVVGAAGGAAASFVGSGGDLEATVRGAAAGAVLGGIDAGFASSSAPQHIAAKAVGGGVAAEIQGGSFEDGLYYGGVTSGARYAYNSMVGQDVTAGSGKNIPGTNPDRQTYEPDSYGRLAAGDQELNVAGLNRSFTGSAMDLLNQGGPVSLTINAIPGGNAVARLDDYFQNRLNNYALLPMTVTGAILVTVPALLDTVPLYDPLRQP